MSVGSVLDVDGIIAIFNIQKGCKGCNSHKFDFIEFGYSVLELSYLFPVYSSGKIIYLENKNKGRELYTYMANYV